MSLIILLQLRWPIESKSSQICYIMNYDGIHLTELWQLPKVSSAFNFNFLRSPFLVCETLDILHVNWFIAFVFMFMSFNQWNVDMKYFLDWLIWLQPTSKDLITLLIMVFFLNMCWRRGLARGYTFSSKKYYLKPIVF